MSLRTSDYDYDLPPELIARHPLARRDASRMMLLRREAASIEHRAFAEFPHFVGSEDLVVLNDTRVIPARIFSEDGKVELLFLEQTAADTWKCMVKPGRRMRMGATIRVAGRHAEVLAMSADGQRLIHFDGPIDFESCGEMPLPPYLRRKPDPSDRDRYQTVFAQTAGAVAAPTAGLHFTPEIVASVPHTFITLHVGIGTFRPVQTDVIEEHRMHEERYCVGEEAARAINSARKIFAVGTTCARVLETVSRPASAQGGATGIFIHPPYRFRAVDALLTNFHLPRSTLLMLVAAFAGREFVLDAYREAIRENYRFYSYGDCMLIL